jgi:hypothetical protein
VAVADCVGHALTSVGESGVHVDCGLGVTFLAGVSVGVGVTAAVVGVDLLLLFAWVSVAAERIAEQKVATLQ